MIITIIGGIGSGKSLSCLKYIKESSNFPITNFNLLRIKFKRLALSDIMKEVTDEKGKVKSYRVNWEYWENMRKRNFSIYLDEANNIISARASNSLKNRTLNKWISQIRKILSDSTTNHIYIVTQLPRMIDVIFRDLTQVVISCRLIESGARVYVLQKFYNGFNNYEMGNCAAKSYFLANPYFKYYNTKEMVRFEDGEKFV